MKEANFLNKVAEIREAWALALETRTNTVNNIIDTAEAALNQLTTEKKDALAKKAKEIKWAISSIYEYEAKQELLGALDNAMDVMALECDEAEAALANRIENMRVNWNDSQGPLTSALETAIEANDEECDNAQTTEASLLADYAVQA